MTEQSNTPGGEVTKVPTKEERQSDLDSVADMDVYRVAWVISKYIAALEHVEAERDELKRKMVHWEKSYLDQSDGVVDLLKTIEALREENARLKAIIPAPTDLNELLAICRSWKLTTAELKELDGEA